MCNTFRDTIRYFSAAASKDPTLYNKNGILSASHSTKTELFE